MIFRPGFWDVYVTLRYSLMSIWIILYKHRWACTLYDRLFLHKSGNTRNWNHSQFSTSFFAVNHFLIYGADACAVLSASHFSKQSSDWTWTWRTQKKNSLFNKNSCEFFSTEYIALANSAVAGTVINMQIPHRSRGKEGSGGRYLSLSWFVVRAALENNHVRAKVRKPALKNQPQAKRRKHRPTRIQTLESILCNLLLCKTRRWESFLYSQSYFFSLLLLSRFLFWFRISQFLEIFIGLMRK